MYGNDASELLECDQKQLTCLSSFKHSSNELCTLLIYFINVCFLDNIKETSTYCKGKLDFVVAVDFKHLKPGSKIITEEIVPQRVSICWLSSRARCSSKVLCVY